MSAPVVGLASQASPSLRGVPSPLAGPGILVVDDDELVRLMLRLGLERHGFRVWCAANGREAVQLCRELGAEVAVVLLEIGMRGMDGLPTLQLLLRQNPQAVVCFMSGGGEYTYDELIRRGARHVFAKPLLLDELARTLLAFVPASAVILPEPGPTVGR